MTAPLTAVATRNTGAANSHRRTDHHPPRIEVMRVSEHRLPRNEHARLIDHSLLPPITIFIEASRSSPAQKSSQRLADEPFATTTVVYLQSRSFQSVQWLRPF
jgi:hypothetical protein